MVHCPHPKFVAINRRERRILKLPWLTVHIIGETLSKTTFYMLLEKLSKMETKVPEHTHVAVVEAYKESIVNLLSYERSAESEAVLVSASKKMSARRPIQPHTLQPTPNRYTGQKR